MQTITVSANVATMVSTPAARLPTLKLTSNINNRDKLSSVTSDPTMHMLIVNFLKLFIQAQCGASTVAIDNKIEQAMDLVKSHLMFAVREEVEVLKEQIKELLEKNSQLEYEINILKANASPETLQKLVNQSSQQPPTTSS